MVWFLDRIGYCRLRWGLPARWVAHDDVLGAFFLVPEGGPEDVPPPRTRCSECGCTDGMHYSYCGE